MNSIKYLNKLDTEDKKNITHMKRYIQFLIDQAKILEGIPLDDSKGFCDKLNNLLLKSINKVKF